MALPAFSNINLFATPSADNHLINRTYADGRYVLQTSIGSDAQGKIPALDANLKLPASVIPEIAITRVYTASSAGSDTGGMLTKSEAQVGDVCIVTTGSPAVSTVYMLNSDAAGAYATASNWTKLSIASGVVNSIALNDGAAQDGAVTITFADLWAGAYKVTDLSTDPDDSNASVASAEAVYDAIDAADTAIRALRAAKDGATFGLISVAADAAGLSVTSGVLTTTAASTSAKGVVQLANDYSDAGFASNESDAVTPKALADYIENYGDAYVAPATFDKTLAAGDISDGAATWSVTHDAAFGQFPDATLIYIKDGSSVSAIADIEYVSTTSLQVKLEGVTAGDQFKLIIRK